MQYPYSCDQRLACGELRITVESSALPLETLCGYACRRNRKRGFLFVSKVLGKHYPVRPSTMRAIHGMLADQLLDLPGPVLMIGLAETATALGQGVYEEWWRRTGVESLYIHTTRYPSTRMPALGFEEQHSHATSHLLFSPDDPAHRDIFARAASVVVIDDELSTGNTLCNLLAAYCEMNRRVRELRVVSITDWLGEERRGEMIGRFAPTRLSFASILSGRFSFEPDTDFDPGEPVDVTGTDAERDAYLSRNYGRYGVSQPLDMDFDPWLEAIDIHPGQRVLVLGSGEFMYPPFVLAERLESMGHDVRFQATTRSPILIGGDIRCAMETVDNYWDGIPNYLYNVEPGQYDRVLIGYETHPLPPEHDLPQRLGAVVLDL